MKAQGLEKLINVKYLQKDKRLKDRFLAKCLPPCKSREYPFPYNWWSYIQTSLLPILNFQIKPNKKNFFFVQWNLKYKHKLICIHRIITV